MTSPGIVEPAANDSDHDRGQSHLIGELLVARKVLSRHQLDLAAGQEARTGVPLARILADQGVLSERDVIAALAEDLGVPFWEPQTGPIDPSVDDLIPRRVAHRLHAVAIGFNQGRLMVAMQDPSDAEVIEELSLVCGQIIEPVLSTTSDIKQLLDSRPETRLNRNGEPDSGEQPEKKEMYVTGILERVVALGGSDLHLTAGLAPSARVDGAIIPLDGFDRLTGDDTRRMVYGILTERQRERFEAELELDVSYSVPSLGRFRINVFQQRGSVGAVLRVIPATITPLEQLGLPAAVAEMGTLPRGLVLLTGPTGSGKSTTLASLVDLINTTRGVHIMTVEDPIEFLHRHKQSIVNQREVGEDTHSFAQALKHVLRQDPDVILVGEMRDLETISAALTAAETGHLVLGTLHTQDAPQSIERIIDVFPAEQQQQIRVQLSTSLQAVVTQQLLPLATGHGRVLACEVLLATPAVRNLIREGKVHQIYSSMQAGAQHGMVTMDQSLGALVRSRQVTMTVALEHCASEPDLRRMAGSR